MKPLAFIVHGRDHAALGELQKLVRALGLRLLTFESVANKLDPNPFIADVVIEGIKQADVALVLFTPDEVAALYTPETGRLSKNGAEADTRWQARPNVIFEAGVAFGSKPHRTLLLSCGADVRLFSDVSGMHILALQNANAKTTLSARLRQMLPGLPKPSAATLRADNRASGNFTAIARRRWSYYDDVETILERMQQVQRIVTTQSGLQGSRATLDQLSAAFAAAGFQILPWRGIGYEGSISLRFEGFDIWDVHPANVLLSPEGLPLPIDVIITRTPSPPAARAPNH